MFQEHPSPRNPYETTATVKLYATRTDLQPPENTILEILRTNLPEMDVFDLGIGAGRTTRHFAPLAKSYLGMDISEPMLAECQKLSNLGPHVEMRKMDVCSMPEVADNSFDLVFFSFNGIDCVSHSDRQRALSEIKRVMRAGGYFGFSTHNLRFNPIHRHSICLTWNPLNVARSLRNFIRFRKLNPHYEAQRSADSAEIYDGTEAFQTKIHYINAEAEISELQKFGFENIRIFSLAGEEISHKMATLSNDPWLYFLATNFKR